MKRIVWLLLMATAFTGCEKDISFDLENQPPKLVVDGQIEEAQPPVIVLTQSLNYFNKITPNLAAESFIHNATITISNGTKTHVLKEYVVPVNGGINLYYYSNDVANPATAFVGETGKQYLLNIMANGKEYTAQTSIPFNARTLDSIWWKKTTINGDTNRAFIYGRFADPKGLGNYVRYFTKTNNNPFFPGENSAFDDQIVDGKTYEVQIDPGIDRNAPPSTEPDVENSYKQGDTITVKVCNIDKASYIFWNTLEFSYGAVGSPFSSPNKVVGNISNGALGTFCGYSVRTRTIILK